MVFADHLDGAYERGVEVGEVLGRYPVLFMNRRADGPGCVALQERGTHAKSGDVPDPAVARVPVSRDLSGVGLVNDRIEDRLFRQARREGPVVRLTDEGELLLPHGSKQDDGVAGIHRGSFSEEWGPAAAAGPCGGKP